jgi:hypothetical protein
MTDFKINRNYENLIKTKKGKIKQSETIVDGSKGLYIKSVGVTKNNKNEVSELIKITVKEIQEKKKFSMRVKTLKNEKAFDDLTKTELVKKLSEKQYSQITPHILEYVKKDMISLRK